MTGKVADPIISSPDVPSSGSSERKHHHHHRRKDRSSTSKGGSKGGSKASSASGSTKQREQPTKNNTTTTNNNATTPATTSTDDDDVEKELFHIIATDTARERMRKISSVTDPCEPHYGVVVATETAHDRMRKMSFLGFEDPVDNVVHTVATAATTTATPAVDMIPSNNNNNNTNNYAPPPLGGDDNNKKPRSSRTEALRKSERERAAIATASPRPRGSRLSRQRVRPVVEEEEQQSSRPKEKSASGPPAVPPVPTTRVPNKERARRTKSDGVKLPGTGPTRLSAVVPGNRPVVVMRKKSRSRSLDDMDDIFQDLDKEATGAAAAAPPPPPPPPEAGPEGSGGGGGAVIGEVIAPTGEQKQLMRKISALGLEDPVFGNVHADMAVNHASMIFEDMNFEDIPDDMRDMLSVVSDHTDNVVRGEEDQIPPLKTTTRPSPASNKQASSRSLGMNRMNESTDVLVFESDYEPPVGSFIRRESKRNLMGGSSRNLMSSKRNLVTESSSRNLQSKNNMISPPASPQPQKPKSMPVISAMIAPVTPVVQPRPTMTRSTPAKNAGNNNENEDTDPLDTFIPPSGSFRIRRPVKNSKAKQQQPQNQHHLHASFQATPNSRRNKETLMQNIQRAKKEEEQDVLKHKFGQSMPDLFDFNVSGSGGDSVNNDSVKPKSLRSAQSGGGRSRKQKSLRHIPHEAYVPPPAPADMASPEVPAVKGIGVGEQHRALPSMEFCFTPRRGVHRKTSNTPTSEQENRMNMLRNNNNGLSSSSSRNCDEDMGIDESPPNGRPPMLKASPDSVMLTTTAEAPSSPQSSKQSKGSGRKKLPAIPRTSRRGSAH